MAAGQNTSVKKCNIRYIGLPPKYRLRHYNTSIEMLTDAHRSLNVDVED